MGDIIIKAVSEPYKRKSDMEKLMWYIAGDCPGKEKTRYVGAEGVSLKPDKAARQMQKIQRAYKKTTGRRIAHYVVSFPSAVEDANAVKLAAVNIVGDIFRGHQVYYGVHEDKDNLHIHFAINTVSYMDGRKWHLDNMEFRRLRERIIETASEFVY